MSGLDVLGWVGGGLGALAYVMVSTRRVVADGALFQGLNMVGAALLCIASFHSGALPSACMNVAWILFGVQSLATSGRRRRRVGALARPGAGHEAGREAGSELIDVDRVTLVLDAA